MISVLWFAWLRERVGSGEERLVLPDDVTDVAGLLSWLPTLDARHASAFERPGLVRCAVNQVFATGESPVRDGDEIALFPPVTGG